MTSPQQIRIADYQYPLPDEQIAKYPLARRDASRLLLYKQGAISETHFYRLPDCLPEKSLLVFNNTRVIQARLLFQKATGASIEVFCLEPAEPHDYALAFQQTGQCTWKCLVGNLKKWKNGLLTRTVCIANEIVTLTAKQIASREDIHWIAFSWEPDSRTFADLLDAAGTLPVPPYLHRETEAADLSCYQTVYSKVKGSVAAPTAGLHFTPETLSALDNRGFELEEITLHVGAGTFKPVKTETVGAHPMHTEWFTVHRRTIARLLASPGRVIAVGTTSVRTIESLYYIGAMLARHPDALIGEQIVGQWMPYEKTLPDISPSEALHQILVCLDRQRTDQLTAATQILIAPGYTFRLINGMLTNFHQPQSTLLLLVAAFAGDDWKQIYDYALSHDFRFLSYGDCSLLLREPCK
ncbi:MAG: S-adenosylmethionine:tRNA ribosyltransferase-isomerase [Tannerella sp.]|jgi:S-adenosylmethionine:tRNA ribosyltransferase-isomerase|nr:S-adenosylmethionine:tRNA ribosyltransferase-isomerase [Tannerella sp.]